MIDLTAAVSAGAIACPMGGTWGRAFATMERHVMRHLRDAYMAPTEVGLTVVETERVDRPGSLALRVSLGTGDTACSTYLDWHGNLSWRRPRTWLDRHVRREIARRRWIMAMVDRGIDPATASFEHRTVSPLLRRLVEEGRLSMTMLAERSDPAASMRCAIGSDGHRLRRTATWHERRQIAIEGVPAMDVHVDHDQVTPLRMELSHDVVLITSEDGRATVRLGRHRLPQTTMCALAGRPLSDLVDAQILDPEAMPVIERMRLRRGGSPEAVLRTSISDGEVILETCHA